MRRFFDYLFFLIVVLPLVVGVSLLVAAILALNKTLFVNAAVLAASGASMIAWGYLWWRYAAIKVKQGQWYVRFFIGGPEYFHNCWIIVIPHFAEVYFFDNWVREIMTGRRLGMPTTVVAQIPISVDQASIMGSPVEMSQQFVLVFQVSYRLKLWQEAVIVDAYLDNMIEKSFSMNESVAFVIRERLSDLVNEVFQQNGDGQITIEDVINRRPLVNRRITDALQASMGEAYATEIISVLINEEPIDAIPNGYMAQRTRLVVARNKSDVDQDVAAREAEARIVQAQRRQEAEVIRQEAELAILEATALKEQGRVKVLAQQALAALQDLEQLKSLGLPVEFAQVIASVRGMAPQQIAEVMKQLAAAVGNPGAQATGSLTLLNGSETAESNPLMSTLLATLTTYQQRQTAPPPATP